MLRDALHFSPNELHGEGSFGLGLILSHGFLLAHGGELWMTTEGEGNIQIMLMMMMIMILMMVMMIVMVIIIIIIMMMIMIMMIIIYKHTL
jgi:signal transduction histidine kinase